MSACFTSPLDIRGDVLHLPDRPGLGVDLDLEYVAAHRIAGWNER
jgi:L-alanine-DL-glutamate epimerase-like enolase superfamily enzyme